MPKSRFGGSGSVYTREYLVFLELLVRARRAAGLTQRELAFRLEKSYSYIAKCEKGHVRMDIFQIRQYLGAVGMPFLEFMTGYEATLQKGGVGATEASNSVRADGESEE